LKLLRGTKIGCQITYLQNKLGCLKGRVIQDVESLGYIGYQRYFLVVANSRLCLDSSKVRFLQYLIIVDCMSSSI
jgi:hypothetical protein